MTTWIFASARPLAVEDALCASGLVGPWFLGSLLLVCLVWVEPGDELANEEPVEFAIEDPVNSDNFAAR